MPTFSSIYKNMTSITSEHKRPDTSLIVNYDKLPVKILYSGKLSITVFVGTEKYMFHMQPVPIAANSSFLAEVLALAAPNFPFDKVDELVLLEDTDVNVRAFSALWNWLNGADGEEPLSLNELTGEEMFMVAGYLEFFAIKSFQFHDIFWDKLAEKIDDTNRDFFVKHYDKLISYMDLKVMGDQSGQFSPTNTLKKKLGMSV